jgi:hypothetical protein
LTAAVRRGYSSWLPLHNPYAPRHLDYCTQVDVYFGCGCFWHVQVRRHILCAVRDARADGTDERRTNERSHARPRGGWRHLRRRRQKVRISSNGRNCAPSNDVLPSSTSDIFSLRVRSTSSSRPSARSSAARTAR